MDVTSHFYPLNYTKVTQHFLNTNFGRDVILQRVDVRYHLQVLLSDRS